MKTVPVDLLSSIALFIGQSGRRLVPLKGIIVSKEVIKGLTRYSPAMFPVQIFPDGLPGDFRGNPKVTVPVGTVLSIDIYTSPAIRPWHIIGIPKAANASPILFQHLEITTKRVK